MENILLKLDTCPSSIAKLETFVSSLADDHNVMKDLYPNILISLTEAVNNAIEHGNCLDKTKSVIVDTYINGKGMSIKVTDEGAGFNPNDIPDPTQPENIECCGGRGVFLIKQLCDDVKFIDEGKTVEMFFNFD